MPSNTPTRGFKPGAERAAKMDAWAKSRGIKSQSEAMKQLIDLGLGVNPSEPKTVKREVSDQIGQLKPGAMKPHVAIDGMQIGPVTPKAGALLDRKSRWRK